MAGRPVNRGTMKGSHELQARLQKVTFKRQVQITMRLLPGRLVENGIDNNIQSTIASGYWWPKHPDHMLMLAATQHKGKLNVADLQYYIFMSVRMVVLGKPHIFCFMVYSV